MKAANQGPWPRVVVVPTEAAELSPNRQDAKLEQKLNFILFLGIFVSMEW